ncbi:eukaryotic translation initiation factor 3-like protein [Cryptosporidium canis]|uniref:Serine-threonine kinase receptor-associated protein n=1 Tax=Cryptosporidium canis TaxID=195482 RepID=A0A9D5HX95_9CRYT|nr:eukaryotic translation initiation factor 3-like protein [Cryptosporidium canis]KAJ1611377.1 eukaryotic translation initiation factor 3-like protein [Cryptosporidium canis]KAJ1613861.1 eukaryotic translation initiation factor 3-like protein [Cryptosporidium canis]
MRPIVLQAHERPITFVTYNFDGDLVFSCGKDGSVACSFTSDGKVAAKYEAGRAAVWNCDPSLDGKTLIMSSADQKCVSFDIERAEIISTYPMSGTCRFVEFNRKYDQQDKFVVAVDQFYPEPRQLLIKKVSDPDMEGVRITGINSRITRAHWGMFDQNIISGHEDGGIYIWDIRQSSEPYEVLRAHSKLLTCCSFSEDRTLMLTCSHDMTAKLWDMVNLKEIKKYTTNRLLNGCSISPNFNKEKDARRHILLGGGQLAQDVTTTGTQEGKFQTLIMHMIYGTELGAIKGHFGTMNALVYAPDGMGFTTGGEDGFVRINHFDEEYLKLDP